MTEGVDTIPMVSEPLVRQYANSLVAKSGRSSGSPVLLLRALPVWDGPEAIELRLDGRVARVLVRPCVSTLAVRDAMTQRGDAEYLLVLTDCNDADLGLGILSRCFDQRVVTPSMWEAVKEAFGARQVDGVLGRMGWVAEPLVQNAPPGGWPVAPAGVLTRDHALSHLTAHVLGMSAGEVDPSGVLAWTLDPAATAAFIEQPPAVRAGIIEWVREVVGPIAGLGLQSTVQSHSIDAVTIGLVADVLWSGVPPTGDVIAARTRLEQWTGIRDLDDAVARSFADAARGAAQRMAASRDPGYPGLLARATALFTDVRYPEGAAASTLLPAGFEARLSSVAAAVRAYLLTGPGALPAVESSFADLMRHVQAPHDRATAVARMAVRLARWLATPEAAAPTDLHQAALRQAREDAYVDWAAADVWVGSTATDVAAVWADLFAAARIRRDVHDRQFATLLADATTRGVLPHGLVPVESAVARVLKPLATAGNRLLVIVVDGMSTAVAAELADEALALAWFEAVPEADGARTAILAALPTLTTYSRTSLFAGRLIQGGQSEERAGFATLTGGLVFHKADLIGAAGQALPGAVLEAIRSDAGMCAVVLNTVDDALAKADPGGTDWTITGIQHLSALLDEAGRAGRTVVLISDHGHVVERGGTPNPIADADARWRMPDTGPLDAAREVALTGSRVLAGGGSVIAAVDESLRYATKRAGYHGGASAAEVVIPVIVLSRTPDDLRSAGWVSAAPQAPAWWNDQVVGAGTPPTPTRSPAPRPTPRRPGPGQGELEIDIPEAVPAANGSADESLVAALIASPIYQAQKARGGPRAVSDDIVSSAVSVLLAQSGRAHRNTLAAAAGIPASRLQSTLVALRRQLNVEQYDVLSLDVDEVTVVLDVPLLRQQFLEDAGA
jgi:hypothetical protein